MDIADLSNEDLENIVSEGVKTVFWKWLKFKLENTKLSARTQLERRKIETLDDCISLAKWNAIFKTTEELINLPENLLKSITATKNNINKLQSTPGLYK